MPSSTRCDLQPTENCNNRPPYRTYFKGSSKEIHLCRQCGSKVGVNMIVSVVMDGGDVEAMFKDIMLTLAHERRLEEAAEEADS